MQAGTALILIFLFLFFYHRPDLFKRIAKVAAGSFVVLALIVGAILNQSNDNQHTSSSYHVSNTIGVDCRSDYYKTIKSCLHDIASKVYADPNSVRRNEAEPKLDDYQTMTDFWIASAEWVKNRHILTAMRDEPSMDDYQTLSAWEKDYFQWEYNLKYNPTPVPGQPWLKAPAPAPAPVHAPEYIVAIYSSMWGIALLLPIFWLVVQERKKIYAKVATWVKARFYKQEFNISQQRLEQAIKKL